MSSSAARHQAMLDEALGPVIAAALRDSLTTDLCINPDGTLWQQRLGEAMRFLTHIPADQTESIIWLVAKLNGQVVHAQSPSLAAILPGGQRFQGFVPPRVTAPTIMIRCPQLRVLTKEDYVPASCTEHTWEVLRHAVISRKNMMLVGGMGSGKSTLMNSMLALIPSQERCATIEDTPELQVLLPNYVSFYVEKDASMEQAVKEALRSNVNRILPGEIRDGRTAIAVLNAWCTGHPGGVCTLHADSAEEALPRLEDLCAQAGPGNYRPLIERSVDVIVSLTRTMGTPTIHDVIAVNTRKVHRYDTKSLLFSPTAPAHFLPLVQ